MVVGGAPRPEYRPDIDGLRAIAVLAVIVFHLFDGYLVAGFLGVDIFFVISGFLITTILLRECAENRYSILDFYVRRIRRIVPALLAVVFVVSVVTGVVFLSGDLIGYSKSVLATFSFASNIYFWRDTDYFSENAYTKPLLHTWSLGIEEQFYIFFPLFMFFIMRRGNRRVMFWATAAVAFLSYLLAGITLELNKAPVAFYLLPMRAWELGLGAMLALMPQRERQSPLADMAGGAVGLALLAAALIFFDPNGYAPIPAATFACLGAALLIRTGGGGNSVSRLLSWRPLVAVGLISYSLYLWHWPVYVIARYLLIREPSGIESSALVLATFVLATLSWRYVEKPFRLQAMSVARVMWISGIGVGALSLAAIAVIVLNGLPGRFPARAATFNAAVGTHYRCHVSSYLRFGSSYACPVNLPDGNPESADVVILGNSHAQMYVPAVAPELAARGLFGLLVPVNACVPVTGFNLSTQCIDMMEHNIARVAALPKVRLVIIAFAWDGMNAAMVNSAGAPIGRVDARQVHLALQATIQTFLQAGKRVIVVGPIPNPGYNIASVVSREIAFRGVPHSPLEQTRDAFDRRYSGAEPWLTRLSSGATAIFPSKLFCDASRCRFLVGGRPAYADDNHLSTTIMHAFQPLFGAAIDEAVAIRPKPVDGALAK